MAEGVSVLPHPVFGGFSLRNGTSKNAFFKIESVRSSVRPEAHSWACMRASVKIGRFRPTENSGIKEEANSLFLAVFALKSLDFISQKVIERKKCSTSRQNVSFFCEFHNSHIFPVLYPQRGLTSNTAGIDSVRPWQKA